MGDLDVFRKMAQCNDKEEMQRFIEEYNYGKKPQTNADRIRAMSDEEMAVQFVEVVKEAIKAIADVDLPNGICEQLWSQFLNKLKEPVKDGE